MSARSRRIPRFRSSLADAVSGEPGVALTGAPVLWAQGVNGQGITVATLDTGVDLTHPELAGRYRGGGNSWFDPYGQHAESHGHQRPRHPGHGRDRRRRGHRHGARCQVHRDPRFRRRGRQLGQRHPCRIPVAARSGPQPGHRRRAERRQHLLGRATDPLQLRVPARPAGPARRAHPAGGRPRATMAMGAAPSDNSPANLPEAFAVGATTDPPGVGSVTIAPFSSRGPSMCGGGQFPALVAPGTGIRSTGLAGFDATGLEGTSFSAPHVAGALALLLQISPLLTANQQASLLTQNAVDLGPPGADSTYGAGLLDVVASARALHSPALDLEPPVLSGAVAADTTLQVRADDAVPSDRRRRMVGGRRSGSWRRSAPDGCGRSARLARRGPRRKHRALPPGAHTLGMRARDVLGNWSAVTVIPITVAGSGRHRRRPCPTHPSCPTRPSRPCPRRRRQRSCCSAQGSSVSPATASSRVWVPGPAASEPWPQPPQLR